MSVQRLKIDAETPVVYRARPRLSRREPIRYSHAGFVVLFFGCIEALVRGGAVSKLVVSPPSAVLLRLSRDVFTDELWQAVLITTVQVAIALLITLVIGLALGYLLYALPNVRKALEPSLVAFYSAPAILLYPVFMTLLGPGGVMIVTMAVIMGAVPISVNMAVGFSSIDPILRKLGKSLGASGQQILFKILLPAAAPVLFAGFRLGLTFALIAVISLEFLTYSAGLGRLISWRYFVFDTSGVYSAILLVSIIAISINSVLSWCERRILARWD